MTAVASAEVIFLLVPFRRFMASPAASILAIGERKVGRWQGILDMIMRDIDISF